MADDRGVTDSQLEVETVPLNAVPGRRPRLSPVLRIVLVAGLIAAVGVFIWTLQGGLRPVHGGPAVGSGAPDFTVQNLPGQATSLRDFRGKTVILNFWATWCAPCRSEMPAINTVAKANPSKVAVVAVDVMEGPVLVQRYVDELHLSFVPVLDTTGTVTQQYHVDSLPTSFFIAPDGTIKAINVGPMDQAAIEQNLRKAGG